MITIEGFGPWPLGWQREHSLYSFATHESIIASKFRRSSEGQLFFGTALGAVLFGCLHLLAWDTTVMTDGHAATGRKEDEA
jgi:hypothetical protein